MMPASLGTKMAATALRFPKRHSEKGIMIGKVRRMLPGGAHNV